MRPLLLALAQSVKADTAIIDGEVVALDENGNPSFQHLQNLTGFGTRPALKGMAPPTLNFFAFDLLYLNGYDLRKAALIDRRQLLISILLPSEIVRYSEHFVGKGDELLKAVRAKGLEGIIAKQAQSRYESRAQRKLDQDQSHHAAGLCDLRIHSRRARTFWRIGSRLLQGQKTHLRWQCGVRIYAAVAQGSV